jgi:Zn-dependent protease with chaperone function
MPFLLLLILTPPCLQDSWPDPGFRMGPPLRVAALTWTAVAGAVLVAGVWAVWARRRLALDPGARDLVLQRYSAWRVYHLIGLAILYGVSVYGFGWGWAVQGFLGTSLLPPGAELLILAPFLIGLLLSWVCFYEIERAVHDTGGPSRFWTRWQYLSYQVRHNLALVAIPVLLLIAMKALQWAAGELHPAGAEVASALCGVVAVGCFIAMPWMLRLVLGLKPLPPGPLRERLLSAARRLHFGCSNILVWHTRGSMANAFVVGLFPFLRYIVLSDRLLAGLTPDELEAVFGHEVGHIKHRHMLYYLGFLLASICAVWAVLAIFVRPHVESFLTLGERSDLAVLAVVGLLAVYVFVVFGFVSRSCERQADVYGCRAVSCSRSDCAGHDRVLRPAALNGLCPTGIRTFIGALEKVADLNGISRDRPGVLQSWQHSTIARRVGFLERVIADPRVEPHFQRRNRLLKGLLLASLLGLVVVLGWSYGWDKLLF